MRTEAKKTFCSALIGEEVGNDNSTRAEGSAITEAEGVGQAEQGAGTAGE